MRQGALSLGFRTCDVLAPWRHTASSACSMKCPSRFCPRIGLRTVFGIVLCEEATALVIVRLHGASGHKSKSQDCTDRVVSGDTLYGTSMDYLSDFFLPCSCFGSLVCTINCSHLCITRKLLSYGIPIFYLRG